MSSRRRFARAPLAVSLALAASLVAVGGCAIDKVTFTPAPVTIGGTVSGLAGAGLVLSINGAEDLAVTGDGAFAFTTPVARGESYTLAIEAQPTGPSQRCAIANGSGVAGVADVRDVQVTCETLAFRVGGTVTGLAGAGLALQNSGGEVLAVTADGAFAFTAPVASGAAYEVTVAMHPAAPTQECLVADGAGIVGDGDVTGVQIVCATRSFAIGGTVTGLAGAGLVLQNNGGDDLPVGANGSFVFPTPVASGEAFAVTVRTQPAGPAQTCAVMGGTGTVGGGDVTSVTVDCTTNRYMIGGTISGLAGTVTLRNNGGDDLQLTANGTFAFPTTVPSGGAYAVTVHVQPAMPAQTCVVAMGSGTVANADVASVVVTCTTNRYSIGGTLSGLASGSTVRLRNNGADDLVLSANGAFTFPILVLSGQPYVVTVAANPSSPISQACAVTAGSGIVGNANVTSVQVACTTNAFTIGGTVSGLSGTGLVLRLNGATSLSIGGNGPFTFPTPLPSGSAYSVTIQTQPSGDPCAVANGTGTVGAANVTSVQVVCKVWSPALFPIDIPGGSGYGDIAFDASGDLLVVVGDAGRIERVNRATGALTTVASGLGAGNLRGVAYRAANDTIYATHANGQIFRIAPDGAVSLLVNGPSQLNAIAIAPPSFGSFGGFLIGVTQNGQVIAVNPTSGAITVITSAAGAASDLAFAPDGRLYISGGIFVRTVTAAGAVTQVVDFLSSADGIAIAPDNTRMFIADSGSDRVYQITIPGGVWTELGAATINGGYAVGGIVAAPGNMVIVNTGEPSPDPIDQRLLAFPY